METTKDDLVRFMNEHSIIIKCEFVPFSRSRNAGEKHRSLNYIVTVSVKGKDVLVSPYSMGAAFIPGIKGMGPTVERQEMEEYATETGRASKSNPVKIWPDEIDVLACLAHDAGAIDYANFEDWAEWNGYDTDSRKAEAAYRSCLETALALRAALGDANLTRLRELASEC